MRQVALKAIVACGTSAALRMRDSFTGGLTSDKGLKRVEHRKPFQDDSPVPVQLQYYRLFPSPFQVLPVVVPSSFAKLVV